MIVASYDAINFAAFEVAIRYNSSKVCSRKSHAQFQRLRSPTQRSVAEPCEQYIRVPHLERVSHANQMGPALPMHFLGTAGVIPARHLLLLQVPVHMQRPCHVRLQHSHSMHEHSIHRLFEFHAKVPQSMEAGNLFRENSESHSLLTPLHCSCSDSSPAIRPQCALTIYPSLALHSTILALEDDEVPISRALGIVLPLHQHNSFPQLQVIQCLMTHFKDAIKSVATRQSLHSESKFTA